jgi:hypothetical protein
VVFSFLLFVVYFVVGLAFFGPRSVVVAAPLVVPATVAAPSRWSTTDRMSSVACSASAVEVLVVELPAAVSPAPGSVLGCSVACAECPVLAGVASLPCALAAGGCPRLAASSGRALLGAALAGRVRRLVSEGVFVVG